MSCWLRNRGKAHRKVCRRIEYEFPGRSRNGRAASCGVPIRPKPGRLISVLVLVGRTGQLHVKACRVNRPVETRRPAGGPDVTQPLRMPSRSHRLLQSQLLVADLRASSPWSRAPWQAWALKRVDEGKMSVGPAVVANGRGAIEQRPSGIDSCARAAAPTPALFVSEPVIFWRSGQVCLASLYTFQSCFGTLSILQQVNSSLQSDFLVILCSLPLHSQCR